MQMGVVRRLTASLGGWSARVRHTHSSSSTYVFMHRRACRNGSADKASPIIALSFPIGRQKTLIREATNVEMVHDSWRS